MVVRRAVCCPVEGAEEGRRLRRSRVVNMEARRREAGTFFRTSPSVLCRSSGCIYGRDGLNSLRDMSATIYLRKEGSSFDSGVRCGGHVGRVVTVREYIDSIVMT